MLIPFDDRKLNSLRYNILIVARVQLSFIQPAEKSRLNSKVSEVLRNSERRYLHRHKVTSRTTAERISERQDLVGAPQHKKENLDDDDHHQRRHADLLQGLGQRAASSF